MICQFISDRILSIFCCDENRYVYRIQYRRAIKGENRLPGQRRRIGGRQILSDGARRVCRAYIMR